MTEETLCRAAGWRRRAIVVALVTLGGCSLVVDSRLDDKQPGGGGDSGVDQLQPIPDIPPKKVRIEASMTPEAVTPADVIELDVLVFGFILAPLDTPVAPGTGHYLVSLAGPEGSVGLLQSSSRHESFSLEDHRQVLGDLEPGPHALVISLHLNDGTPVAEEATVELPFELCIAGAWTRGCPPPEPCAPKEPCDPCQLFPGGICPPCVEPDQSGPLPSVRIESISPALLSGGDLLVLELEVSVTNFRLKHPDDPASSGGHYVATLEFEDEEVVLGPQYAAAATVEAPYPELPPTPGIAMLYVTLVTDDGSPIDPLAEACWPLVWAPADERP